MKHILFISITFSGVLFSQEAQILSPESRSKVLPKTSTDASDLLVVMGDDNEIRSRILSLMIDVKKDLYALFGLYGNTQEHVVEVSLYGEEGGSAPALLIKKGFSELAGEYKLTLDVHLSKGISEENLREALTELFLYEIGMKEFTPSSDDELSLKIAPWVTKGVREAIKWKTNTNEPALYARLFRQKAVYSIEELLSVDADDENGETDQIFQVSSGVLVMALLNQPQGKEGLLSLIKEAPTYGGEQRQLISKHFPDMTLSKTSLSKWWSLQLLTMSERTADKLYTISETERELARILDIRITGADGETYGYSPDSYSEMKKHGNLVRNPRLIEVMNNLSLLQTKAFPPYRPLIGGYQQSLVRVIGKKKRKKPFWSFFTTSDEEELSAAEMLSRLEFERGIFLELGKRTTDYLNWYELETGDSSEGDFDEYLKLKKDLENSSSSDGGHIAKYLDDIEKLYKK